VKPYIHLLDADKVWKLERNKRVQLVYVFQSTIYVKASSEFQEVSGAYAQLTRIDLRVGKAALSLQIYTDSDTYIINRNQHDIDVMKKCHVIGMTVTGAAMRANLLADIKPFVMIVEEAAEILEGQLVAVIPPSVQHLIMIGDHQQLKPVVHFHRLKKYHHLDLSMFERLVKCKLDAVQAT
ncbi:NFX1-type zinc finger-containing protein 1, partial [Desmophyllum pertusum]